MKKWFIPITIVCIISGLLLSLQLKAQDSLSSNPIGHKNEILAGIIKNLEDEIERYQKDLSDIRTRLDEIEHSNMEMDMETLQTKAQKAKITAGLTQVKGRGITITIDDNKNGLIAAPNEDPNRYIIHYENLLNILTDLKLGSPEALSINNQRIVTTSEIRCVGNVIMVNTSRLAPPFIIKAIGDPDILENYLLYGEYDLLKNMGFPVNYTKHSTENPVIIHPYSGSYRVNYTTTLQ